MIVLLATQQRRYAARTSDFLEIVPAFDSTPFRYHDAQQRPCDLVPMAPLLDPTDLARGPRQRALIIPLRRRVVGLLFDHVEQLEHGEIRPVPELLRVNLSQPWIAGTLIVDDQPLLVLDLRAIAMSVAVKSKG